MAPGFPLASGAVIRRDAMSFLPDWAPTAHPFLVHFPITLLTMAAVVDVATVILKRSGSGGVFVTCAYLGGVVTLLATYLTGRSAAMTVLIPGMAHSVVEDHWTWALWCLWYFVVLTGSRLLWRVHNRQPTVRLSFAVAGLVGIVLLVGTADRGGQLVYKYGVGFSPPVTQE